MADTIGGKLAEAGNAVAEATKKVVNKVGEKVEVGSSRVDLQACKLEYSIVSPK